MSTRDLLEKVAEHYRSEGYDVVVAPLAAALPAFLAGSEVDLLARKGSEHVAVQVKGRDELYDISPVAKVVNAQPGWRYDLVVHPLNGFDEVPQGGAEPGPAYVESLMTEADRILGCGGLRSAFVIAWSAVEAAIRQAARRHNLTVSREGTRFGLKTLYANGVLSREDFEKLEQSYLLRNQLVHGLEPERLDFADAQFLVELAKRLLAGQAA